MTPQEAIAKIQPTLDQFSYVAGIRSGTEITLTNKNRELCGVIDLAEPALLKIRYVGAKTMMGSLVVNPICKALGCASGKY